MSITEVRESAPATAAPSTAASPSPRSLWQTARLPLVIGGVLVLVALIVAVTSPRGDRGTLDPNGVDKDGAHALATLLRDNGVEVTRVRSARAAQALAGPQTTVLVTLSVLVPPRDLTRLAQTASDLVVLAPASPQLAALGLPVSLTDRTDRSVRQPDCGYAAATLAGQAETGGDVFSTTSEQADACYPADGGATLVHVPGATRSVTVVGTGIPWTNGRLAHEGNAALALNVLGTRPHLVWVVPDLAAALRSAPGGRSITSLLPTSLVLAVGQLGVAVVLLALWRARRLGPVVAEPLPVVVRAAETVEGRARLYHAAHARARAAEALRAGVRRGLVPALGLSADPEPDAVVATVAQRTGRAPESVRWLLYGAALDATELDDAALVRLADDLDHLDREVRRP